MFTKLKDLHKSQNDGFTIIEVLIVLAIAGLIMVVVFLAVPNLQRSQRNNGRKSDANSILAAMSDYVSNNAGSPPSASCSNGTTPSCNTLFLNSIKLGQYQVANISYVYSPNALPTAPTQGQAVLMGGTNMSCNGPVPQLSGGSAGARSYLIWFGLEGGVGTGCTSGN